MLVSDEYDCELGAREMRIRVKGRNSRRGWEDGSLQYLVVEQKGTILSLSALSRFLLAKDAPAPRREVSPGHSGVSVRSIVLIGDFSGLPGSVRCT